MSLYALCKKVTVVVLITTLVIALFYPSLLDSNMFIRTVNPTILAQKNQSVSLTVPVQLRQNNFHNSTTTTLPRPGQGTETSDSESKFIVNTAGCRILKTPIMPEYFKKRWRVHKIPQCDYEKVLAELNDAEQTLMLTPEFLNSNCCISEVTRVSKNDSSYRLSSCDPLETPVDISQKEILVTKCDNYLNFEANFPFKPKVKKKLEFWKNVSPEDVPISVLFLGIDSVSRSHAYRSLPKTMNLLKEMGFVDFPGYHSVAASTLSNFMAFLIGLPRKEVRKSCAPNWKSPFDSCPFIWKDFALNNYITMYIEDGSQSFNWGDQSGFHNPPTDYYVHSLFTAMNDLRIKYSGAVQKEDTKEVDNRVPCSSSETVPQFLLRYTKRFVQKFQSTPFFAFTWLANPFHDYLFSLSSIDEELFEFFTSLKAMAGFLDKTLIVLVSDHGDRTSFFESKTMDAFIERGLPPLFIRIPEKLKIEYPELDLDNVIEQNAQALVSPFDLHHTFLHVLALAGLNNTNTKASEFEPIWADRTSLLTPIDSSKKCEQINIESGNCVCNTDPKVETIRNPFYLTKIVDFVGKRLNRIVSASKYKKVCEKWKTRIDWIISTQVFHTAKGYTDIILQFAADPGSAQFEGKIRIVHEKSNFDSCRLIGEFSRINLYGNQSSCVKFETDADKEMKQFCMCKSHTPVKENRT